MAPTPALRVHVSLFVVAMILLVCSATGMLAGNIRPHACRQTIIRYITQRPRHKWHISQRSSHSDNDRDRHRVTDSRQRRNSFHPQHHPLNPFRFARRHIHGNCRSDHEWSACRRVNVLAPPANQWASRAILHMASACQHRRQWPGNLDPYHASGRARYLWD